MAFKFVKKVSAMVKAVVLQFPPMAKREHIYHGPNRTREFRKRAKLTLKQAAPLVGLSWTHLARIETGERELNTIWMERLAKAFGCAPADLLPFEMGGLSEQERHVVETLRALPEAARAGILALVESQRQFLPSGPGADIVPFPKVG